MLSVHDAPEGSVRPGARGPIAFGPFVFDPVAWQLSRAGDEIRLQPKVLQALVVLLERPGELLTRAHLDEVLWPSVHVSDASLAQVIRKLRRALGDSRTDPRFIETVQGLGYRFIATVSCPNTTGIRDPGFVGRARPLQTLERLLEDRTPLITVLGAPGIGKSRLVQHLALSRPLCRQISLRGVVDQASAEALLTPPPRPGTLVILDDVDGAAPQLVTFVHALVRSGLQVLVTSRTRLRLPGERCLELEAMPEHEAMLLLHQRAEAVRVGLSAGLSTPTTRDLVERLEGLPLAIELAAPRLLVMSPDALLQRLEEGTIWLGTGRRAQQAPQRSLREAIAQAWQRLEPAAKRLCARCAAFPGGFDHEMARQALDDEPAEIVSDLLVDLRDRSLLRILSSRPMRFGFFAPIREYALEQRPHQPA